MAATNAVLVADQARTAGGGLGQRLRRHPSPVHEDPRPLRRRAFAFLDTTDAAAFDRAAGAFDLLWIETPTNPLMKVCDIAALAEAPHRRRAILVVDNTFMSPFFQRPLELGADIVVHSTTKFLNGHSDSVGGVAVVKDKAHAEWLQYYQNAAGAILSPFDSWLVLRGTKTLAVRMPRHEENGRARGRLPPRAARRSARCTGRASPTIPGHEVHKRQASRLRRPHLLRPRQRATPPTACCAAVQLCSLGESLGGVETLISHPATMTHAGYTPAERAGPRHRRRAGADQRRDARTREDLIADLRRALDAV